MNLPVTELPLSALHLTPDAALVLWGAFLVISAALHALPEPTQQSSAFYVWAHNIAQIIPGNFSLVKFPNKKQD
jgi:hypothetical protein